eukprot:3713610-Alexandrium_andersonii.AAC.1
MRMRAAIDPSCHRSSSPPPGSECPAGLGEVELKRPPRGSARARWPLVRVGRRSSVRRLRQALLPGTLDVLELSDIV